MNFQKTISTFLAILVLFLSTNVALNIHICQGVVAAIQTTFDTEEPCNHKHSVVTDTCCYNQIDEATCCSDKVIKADIDDIVLESSQISIVFLFKEIITLPIKTFAYFNSNKILTYFCDANGPPLYKLYQKRIFYA